MTTGREALTPTCRRTCVLCTGTALRRPFAHALPWLAQCEDCGLAFVDPQPDARELAAIYTQHYFESFGFDEAYRSAYRAIKFATFLRYFQWIERRTPVGRLLDVGSGTGELLELSEQRGWQTNGVEPNHFACAASKQRLGTRVFCGRFEEYDPGMLRFDLIVCMETFEHLRCPRSTLARMHAFLRPGGLLALTAPDHGSLSARVQRSKWFHYHRDHLWYFNRRTLASIVTNAGFQVLECGAARKTFNLRYLFGAAGGAARASWFTWASKLGLRCLPRAWLEAAWPPVPQGLWLLARRAQGRHEQRGAPLATMEEPAMAADAT